ncbi:unnamed protein product [Brassica oleracea]
MLRLFKGQPSICREIFILDTLISSRLCGTGCTVKQTHSGRYFLPSARTEHWPSHEVSCSGSIMGLHTNSRSNEILALVKSLFLMERHGVISAWSRKITVADIIKCAKVSVIPFAVHMGEVCSVHKLKINLYKPEHYPKHTDITEAHFEETMTVMFLRKLEDAEHAIFIFAAYASHITDKFEEDYGSRYYKNYGSVRSNNDDQAEAKGTEAVDLDADAQKRKKQATDEQGYEESCDDEKNEPSFTSGVDDLVMDNEDENTEVAYCGDPQVIWEELHNQLLNSAE